MTKIVLDRGYINLKCFNRDTQNDGLSYEGNDSCLCWVVSEWVSECLTPTQQFFSYIMARTGFWWDSSLKQQSAGRHVAPPGHIIPIPSQPIFALTP
jgi:hypothetical protein